jgi:hypothetical protein
MQDERDLLLGTQLAPVESCVVNSFPGSIQESINMADTKDKMKKAVDNAADATKKAVDKSSAKARDAANAVGDKLKATGKKVKEMGR